MIDRLTPAGTETQLIALIRDLDRSCVEPFLCLLDGNDERSRSLEPADCPVLRLGVRALHHPATLREALRLGRFLRRERIDVFQVYFKDSSYLGVPVARLAGVRHIVRTRNNLGYWMSPLHRWLGRLCNHWTDVVIANCDACRQAVISGEGVSPARVQVLENGVDLSRFPGRQQMTFPPNYSVSQSFQRIGIVANLRPVKNLDLFIRAAAEIVKEFPQATFHIAGQGQLRHALDRLRKNLGLARRLFLHGLVSDIPAFLAGLDLAVLCSRSEGMSNALLEYMAAGKPIIATAVGANVQLIEHNVHGLLVPSGDQAALTGAIRRLLRDPTWARWLGTAARIRVQESFSREAMVRRFEAFYLELVASKLSNPLAA
jgi:glycosyltransferase involved in cell wall biosynthesis